MGLHRLKCNKLLIILSLCFSFVVENIHADQSRGLEIAKAMEAKESGFVNYQAEMRMVLIDSNGREKERLMRVKTREVENDGDQSIAIFEKPADVKGTAFLSHTHIRENDAQWLYLPALKRVKRISVRNKISPFMGSEFSYEDLASTEVEKYTYQYIGEDQLNGEPCFIIERFPKDEYSGYNKQKVWVEKERYLVLKIEYFNRKNILLKTLRNANFKLHLDKFWRAQEMHMENHISGKRSVLYWDNFKFQRPFSDADFTPTRLKRAR